MYCLRIKVVKQACEYQAEYSETINLDKIISSKFFYSLKRVLDSVGANRLSVTDSWGTVEEKIQIQDSTEMSLLYKRHFDLIYTLEIYGKKV